MSKNASLLLQVLQEEYPHLKIRKEVALKYGDLTLYVDFLIPALGLSFEVDGRQHEDFVPHFHKTKTRFITSKINDGYKKEILERLHCKLIRFNHTETINKETLRKKIQAINAEEN